MNEPAKRTADLPVNASEGAAAAAAVVPPTATSLATLLSRHILRDGEMVILLLKPSVLFIPLSSLRFAAAVLVCMAAVFVFDIDDKVRALNVLSVVELGIFLITGRLMLAVLQWNAMLYVLTDLRVLRISGIFNVQIFDCPLRKVARTRLQFTARERITGLGTIEIIPLAEDAVEGLWQTISRPRHINEQLVRAINKAKQGGLV